MMGWDEAWWDGGLAARYDAPIVDARPRLCLGSCAAVCVPVRWGAA